MKILNKEMAVYQFACPFLCTGYGTCSSQVQNKAAKAFDITTYGRLYCY